MYIGKYRHELKFICAEQDLFLIDNKIRHICRRDANAEADGTYLVKSLYFDTLDDRCYYENQAGVDNRRKYRVRIYNNNFDIIKLECKYSYHDMKRKEICSITKQQCSELISGRAVYGCHAGQSERQKELWNHFLLERKTDMLVPKVIVEYRRTAYIFPAGNVRITFDRAIRSSSCVSRFFDDYIPFRNIMTENTNILEVKYDEAIPAAIWELLSAGQDLSRTSFSKYVLCREYSTR